MSYENVKAKVNELEQAGYMDKGDHSVEYMTCSNEILNRFFSDNLSDEARKHLKKKLRSFLEKENVIFSLGYSLLVVPSDDVADIINNSASYTQMALELEKIPFVNVYSCDSDCIKINFSVNNHSIQLLSDNFKYVINSDVVELSDESSSYGSKIIIKSKNCEEDNELKVIDGFFD